MVWPAVSGAPTKVTVSSVPITVPRADSIEIPTGASFGSHTGGWTVIPSVVATAIRVTRTFVPSTVNSHVGAVAGPRLVCTVAVVRPADVTCKAHALGQLDAAVDPMSASAWDAETGRTGLVEPSAQRTSASTGGSDGSVVFATTRPAMSAGCVRRPAPPNRRSARSARRPARTRAHRPRPRQRLPSGLERRLPGDARARCCRRLEATSSPSEPSLSPATRRMPSQTNEPSSSTSTPPDTVPRSAVPVGARRPRRDRAELEAAPHRGAASYARR